MSNKKDYKIFRRISKVLTRDIVFREVIRTLIQPMKIGEDETNWLSIIIVVLAGLKIY